MLLRKCFEEVYGKLKAFYKEHNIEINLPKLNKIDEKTSKQFIIDYFHCRGKSIFQSSELFGYEKSEMLSKSTHSFFVYLLGIYFVKNVKENYEKELTYCDFNDLEYFEYFEWLWFMIALYHDAFSANEKKENDTSYKKQVFKILDELYCDKNKYTYPKEVVKAYFEYRKKNNILDHGIFGGLIELERLKENLSKVLDGKSETVSGNMNFNCKDVKVYNKVADAIISHNVWCVMENDIKSACIYRAAGLESLIYKKNDKRRLKFSINNLAFLLGLIDSIEPYKFFRACYCSKTVQWVLDNIDIEIEKTFITIDVIGEDKTLQCWYENKLKKMEEWLSVKMDYDTSEKKIKIIYNFAKK